MARQTYSITKRCGTLERQIIADPLVPLTIADNADAIISSLFWLQKRDRITYYGYVIMPDHIHFMMQLGDLATLSEVMHSFSGHTAKAIQQLNGWSGQFWQVGFYDHAIRNNEAFDRHLNYIAENPLRKRFVDALEDWPFMQLEPDW